jgi:hypothetical protein
MVHMLFSLDHNGKDIHVRLQKVQSNYLVSLQSGDDKDAYITDTQFYDDGGSLNIALLAESISRSRGIEEDNFTLRAIDPRKGYGPIPAFLRKTTVTPFSSDEYCYLYGRVFGAVIFADIRNFSRYSLEATNPELFQIFRSLIETLFCQEEAGFRMAYWKLLAIA